MLQLRLVEIIENDPTKGEKFIKLLNHNYIWNYKECFNTHSTVSNKLVTDITAAIKEGHKHILLPLNIDNKHWIV
ncbi:MAG: hypothetical protein EOP45_20945 [Sphingobacteriaceae bacterium]|nr:MAG: hypothetical protein EOP45_20945 [Sphingobacteriaceae bacterium]